MENFILIGIAIFGILFIALFWLRQNLLTELHEAKAREDVLNKDFQKRRDTVPYLLESARNLAEPNDAWRKLAEDRAKFMVNQSYSMELDFENSIQNYLNTVNFRTLNFLEAKKDIEDLSTLIEQQKKDRQSAIDRFNQRRKQFPYSLASAIFGFRELRA